MGKDAPLRSAHDRRRRSQRSESPIVARTRLVPPRLRAEVVDRPALVARRMTSPARLGVVRGPAGSGKSTLLAQCFAADPLPAWLSLESSDNDAVAVVVVDHRRAARRHRATSVRRTGSRLHGGSGAVDEVVVSVCNELAERNTPIHLFLDDIHLVEDEMSRRSLHQFVLSIPDGVRMTVASRQSVPIPLGRIRANGDLVEIGPSDLALSTQEADQLMSSSTHRSIRQNATFWLPAPRVGRPGSTSPDWRLLRLTMSDHSSRVSAGQIAMSPSTCSRRCWSRLQARNGSS